MSGSSNGGIAAITKIKDKDCFFCDSRFDQIKAIVGIGNPGSKFAQTRHNAGFEALDALAEAFGESFDSGSQVQSFTKVFGNGRTINFYKPQTFVNRTGELTTKLKSKGLTPDQIMVVYDDMEKAPGFLGFKLGGSAKGHNGVKSVIQSLGFEFWRLTIGIGRPVDDQPVDQYVLGRFLPAERSVYDQSLQALVRFFDCDKLRS